VKTRETGRDRPGRGRRRGAGRPELKTGLLLAKRVATSEKESLEARHALINDNGWGKKVPKISEKRRGRGTRYALS